MEKCLEAPWKKTERLSRFVWRRSAGLPRTSAEKFICVQMDRSPRSDIQMRWFQFEELDIEVTYNTSEDERNRSYESKVMAILLKCVGAVLKWLIQIDDPLERPYGRSSGPCPGQLRNSLREWSFLLGLISIRDFYYLY